MRTVAHLPDKWTSRRSRTTVLSSTPVGMQLAVGRRLKRVSLGLGAQ